MLKTYGAGEIPAPLLIRDGGHGQVHRTEALQLVRATDDRGEAALNKLAHGELIEIEVRKPRNLKHHRLFWVLMELVWHQSDNERYPTVEDFADAVKIMAGLRKTIYLPDGNIVYVPGSIAFANMDQTVFSAFYDRVCDVIARDFLPGVTTAQLHEEVSTIIGITPLQRVA